MKTKIIITGGAGFIGSAIIQYLKNYDYDIYVIDNLSFGKREYLKIDDANFFNLNILDRDKIFEIFKIINPEIVVHLAAVHFIPYCNAHPFESTNINIQGTINIVDAASNIKGLKKLFFASTAAVYPIINYSILETNEIGATDIYGISKVAGEKICHNFYLNTNIPTIICRFFNAFGPNETNPHLFPEIEKQIKSGMRKIKLGNLSPKRDYIHTYDMAAAVKSLLELNDITFDIFNLGRGIEYSVIEIVEAFGNAIGEKLDIEIEESRVRNVDRPHLLANIQKLKNRTNWVPKWSIEQGIKQLFEYDNYKI